MRFYLTTAIDYVNSRPHLGTAYEKITADVIARYKRLAGFDVRFVMGNDPQEVVCDHSYKDEGEVGQRGWLDVRAHRASSLIRSSSSLSRSSR